MNFSDMIRLVLLGVLLVSPVALAKTGARQEEQEPQRVQQEQQKITEISSEQQSIEKKEEELPPRAIQQEEQLPEKWEQQQQQQLPSAERKTRLESEFKPAKSISKLEEPTKALPQREQQVQQTELLAETGKGLQKAEEQLEKKEPRKQEELKQVKSEELPKLEQQREQPALTQLEITKEPKRVEQQQMEVKQEQQNEEQLEEREPIREQVSEELPAPIKGSTKEQSRDELVLSQQQASSKREPLLRSQVYASEPELYTPSSFGYRASDFRLNDGPVPVYSPVRGYYILQSPDGYYRRLEYYSDRSGFRVNLEQTESDQRSPLASNLVIRSYQQRPDEITLRLEPAYVPVTRASYFDRQLAPVRLSAEQPLIGGSGFFASKLSGKGAGRLVQQQQQLPAITLPENPQLTPIKSGTKFTSIKQELLGELKQQHRAYEQPIRMAAPTYQLRTASPAPPALRPAQLGSGSWKGPSASPLFGRRHYPNPLLVQLYPVGVHPGVGPRPLFPPTPVESAVDYDRGFERSD